MAESTSTSEKKRPRDQEGDEAPQPKSFKEQSEPEPSTSRGESGAAAPVEKKQSSRAMFLAVRDVLTAFRSSFLKLRDSNRARFRLEDITQEDSQSDELPTGESPILVRIKVWRIPAGEAPFIQQSCQIRDNQDLTVLRNMLDTILHLTRRASPHQHQQQPALSDSGVE